jgi:hypothetical protein
MGHLRIQIFAEITREREHSLTYVMCTKLSPVCDSYVHKCLATLLNITIIIIILIAIIM